MGLEQFEQKSRDRREGDSTLDVRNVPTDEGRRPATTIRSDSGADRTVCDSTRGVSTWLRSDKETNRICLHSHHY
jgi:hypothetical protein